MNRREFMARTGVLAGAACMPKPANPLNRATSPLDRFKLGATSDGLSQDFEYALKIMKNYGLSWVEIRVVWGKYNTEATAEQVHRIKDLLDQYQFKCSVVDSAVFKCTLPGTRPLGNEKDVYPYSQQMDLLKRAIDRAHAWGTDKVRIFSFWRVDKPRDIARAVQAEIQKAAEVARAAGIRLAIEEEPSCNVATGRELAETLRSVAGNVGANWDVGSGLWLGEVPYPDGYLNLDPRRVWNLHLKGVRCGAGFTDCDETFADQGQIDLVGQLRALLKDGYQETLSVECEFKAPGLSQTETTRRALEAALRVAGAAIS
jgi:sugar phosphate isomerase/epimerase